MIAVDVMIGRELFIVSEFDLTALRRDFGDVHAEARACRTRCALFDFSFMSRGRLSGEGAVEVLTRYQPRPIRNLSPGRICYALRLSAHGRVEADLTIWNLGGGCYEVMSGRSMDIAALEALATTGVRIEDLSESTRIFAIQGPRSLDAIADLTDADALAALDYFAHGEFEVARIPCRVGRLGYTGEKGFELVVDARHASRLWSLLAERIPPAGFAAADCLRIEAGFILFANECRTGPTPEELALGRLAADPGPAPRQQLVCFEASCRVTPVLWQPDRPTLPLPTPGTITITSACRSVVRETHLGLGFVVPDDVASGRGVHDPSGAFQNVTLVSLPAYDPEKQRPRGIWREQSAP
jgi:aminomethyltransferase